MALETSPATLTKAKQSPTLSSPKIVQSAPDHSRRNSLPHHFLPTNRWSANTSTASLAETDQAARGEHILDEGAVANRISALRQLKGSTRSRHRYAKSTGARSSTYNQPVIVRTYSGPPRQRTTQKRDLVVVKRENGYPPLISNKMDLKLPPVEAFSFKGIMDEIRSGVSEDLERIAEICARSKYSLSNQYEVHMPPHGRGDLILVGTASNGSGPTLEAIASDDEQSRHSSRRGGRRTRSMAYGTLETIISSSRSSEEDKSKKKPAAVLAEEVRGRVMKQLESLSTKKDSDEDIIQAEPDRPTRHVRSKSATFASIMIDNTHGSRHDTATSLVSPISLISEPARPQTSTAILDSNIEQGGELTSPTSLWTSFKTASPYNAAVASPSRVSAAPRPSILESISTWLPWSRYVAPMGNFQSRARNGSYAEGSLRDLLKSTRTDTKGKSVDRSR